MRPVPSFGPWVRGAVCCALLVPLAADGHGTAPAGSTSDRIRVMRPAGAEEDGPTPARSEPDASDAARRPRIRIDFDLRVVERLLELADRGGATDEELSAWADLPGNHELLRLGAMHGGLTRAGLAEAARAALRGETSEAGPPLGRLVVGSWDELRRMTVALRSRWPRLAPSIAAAIAPYLPAGRPIPPITVRFHLGGQWDGRTFGEVYVNLSFFQARGPDSLEGLDALLVHEVFHQAQAVLLPGVEDYSSPQSCLFYTFQRIEQEGIARHLEYRYLREHAPDTSLDRTNFEKYRDGLRHAAENAGMLGQMLEAASHHDLRRARLLIDEGFTAGGPLYAVGHSMALRIDRRLGTGALRRTVATGPIAFFRAYAAAVHAGGEPTILPAGTLRAVEEVARGYGRHFLEATHLRRRGLRLIEEGRLEKAVAALRRACHLDPSDAVSAYNLACARALQGRHRAALHWLERSVGRGFDDARLLRTDPDLATVRDDDAFRRLLLRMIRPAEGATRGQPPGDRSEEIGP